MASIKLCDPFLVDVKPVTVTAVADLAAGSWDAAVIVAESLEWSSCSPVVEQLKKLIVTAAQYDKSVDKELTVHLYPTGNNFKWIVYSPTGPVNRDYDDVRRYRDAIVKGFHRALKAGHRRLLLILPGKSVFKKVFPVSVLATLEAVYVPLEIREDVPCRSTKVDEIGIFCAESSSESMHQEIAHAVATESGRIVAKDIGGSDPERMAAPKAAAYVTKIFADSSVKVSVLTDDEVFTKKYPLLAAVNRCANHVDRHKGAVVELEYTGEGTTEATYLFVGKGITYDTGGADVKAGGHMAGMHRDKCGAATVAGLFKVLNELKPKGVRVLGTMAMVRNSIGADCYVADEIITSAAGVRIRVGNTDAEGRMVMADCLHYMSQKATKEINPHIFTIATLTGHAIRAMGPAYSITIDNGPARKKNFSQRLQSIGHELADPFEISTLRREDYQQISGPSEYEDVLQCNNLPSTGTPRGHQFPAAFLARASGLDKFGVDSSTPLCYTHMDIAGSSGPFPGLPTGAPLPTLVAMTTGLE